MDPAKPTVLKSLQCCRLWLPASLVPAHDYFQLRQDQDAHALDPHPEKPSAAHRSLSVGMVWALLNDSWIILERERQRVIVTIRDNKNYGRVLLCSWYSTITGWGLHLNNTHKGRIYNPQHGPCYRWWQRVGAVPNSKFRLWV